MTTHSDIRSLFEKALCLTLCLVVLANASEEECDRSKCPGPLRYYTDLGCKPIYEKPGDCCASKFDCDHLKERAKNKCYVNGKEYNLGDSLKKEDANPCDLGCTCHENNGVASFVCAVVDCFYGPSNPDCYRKNSPDQCCPGPEVCPKSAEERPTCEVDGKTYYDGEYFKPSSNPELNCYCMEGYKGENVEPFCKKPNRPYCSPDFRNPSDIYNNCAPVFYQNQSPQTDCSVFNRCQNANDTVIHNHDVSKSGSDESLEEDTCVFGNLKLHLGDELNQGTDYNSVCVKCVCEVPPLPTCQRLPDAECDVTKHAPFQI